MRKPRALCILSLGAVLVMACGDDRPTASSGDRGGANYVSVGTDDGGTTSDAAVPLPDLQPDVCKAITLGSRIVDELAHAGDPPVPYGGTVAPGTYELDALDVWAPFDAGTSAEAPSEGASGRSGSGTMVVTANTIAIVEAYGPSGGPLGMPDTRGYGYVADQTDLAAAEVCPNAVATTRIGYSVSGEYLAIFVDATHRATFHLQSP